MSIMRLSRDARALLQQSPSSVSRRPVRTQIKRVGLVCSGNFLLATRDAGYRGTAYAVAEFVDNSIQAGARSVHIDVVAGSDETYPVELLVTDDGRGMDDNQLALALAFGGSTRFDDRSSLGRYGMGLPNGALSRARRVEVYSWQQGRVRFTYLDVDDLVATEGAFLPPISVIPRPSFLPRSRHGTVVRLCRCDRLEFRRVATLVERLHQDLGRIYRRFIWRGLELRVNGVRVVPVDPLHQQSKNGASARLFGETLKYRIGSSAQNTVEVRFAELPIEQWHGLPPDEKKRLGVTSGASVSVMRADREIDRGWFFMGAKRRENYDDWWRCEVSFDPTADELFGLTNAKQAINPTEEVLRALCPDIESIARALNARVRHRFELIKSGAALGDAEAQAARAERMLPAIPRGRRKGAPDDVSNWVTESLRAVGRDGAGAGAYRLIVGELPTTAAFEVTMSQRTIVLLLNSRHPLYRDLYGPLAMSDDPEDRQTAKQVALALLAAGRAELATLPGKDQLRRFRQTWADVLATFYSV